MPQLLAPLIVTASAGAIGTAAATTIATAALYVGTTAASMLIQQAQQPTQETGTKLHPASGGDVSQSIIVGEKETAGSLIYAGSWGQPGRTPNAFYVSVYDLQDMPSTAILERCWHADNKGTLDLSRLGYTGSDAEEEGEIMGYPVDSLRDDDGNDYAWVKFLDGSQTTADSYLRTMFGGLTDKPWKSTMIGRGRTLMIVTEKFNVDDPTAEKNFTVVIQGMKLYDWRKDSTNGGSGSHRWGDASTYEYSANPIVIAYNIMRGIFRGSTWLYGGQNWPARRFDNDTWTAAANTCDENITLAGGGTEKRCRMGAEISLAEDPASVLERVFASCGGRLVESGGIYKIHVGGIGASVYSFTDDDIFVTEDRSGTLFPSREDICNTITGSYCEPSNGGQMKAYGKRFKQAYIDADGGEVRPKEMTFEYVRENRQAQRLAAHALNDNRRFTTRSIVLPPIARKLEPEDTLSWTGDRYGYSNKKWICGDITLSDSGLVIAAIREADAADADWSPSDEKPYTVGVYGDIVPATQTIDITAVAAGIKNAAGTNKAPGIKISWTIDKDMVDCKAVRWQVRLLDIDDVMDAGRVEFDEGKALIKEGILRNEVYQVRARIIPYSDRKTGWCAWKTVTADNYGAIGDDDFDNTPPPNIPNNPIWLPTVSNKPQVTSDADKDEDGKVVITVTTDWVELANDKIDYQIRLAYGSKVRWLNARSSPREFVGRSGVAYTIRVRPIGRTGVKGNLSDPITFTATKKSTVPDTPTSLTATAKFGRIVLRWNKPAATETDFRRANVYVSDDNNFAHATLLDNFTASKGEHGDLGNNVTKFYWITFENWSGIESLKFPVSDTGGRTATTLRVADDDTDQSAPGTPSAPALSQYTAEVGGDSTIDTGLQIPLTIPAGVPVKFYEVEIHQSPTVGGTYVARAKRHMVKAELSGTTTWAFEGSTNKFYKARYRGIAFSGKEGAYSPLTTTGIQPLQYLSSIPTPTVTVTPRPKSMLLRWPKWQNNTFSEAIIYRDGVEIDRTKASYYSDQSELTIGGSYTYTVQLQDKQDRVGALSSGVTATYRAALTIDISDKAIIASKADLGDTSNMTIDTNLAVVACWATNATGIVQATPNIVSASQFRLVTSPSSTASRYIQSAPDYRIPVEGGKRYTYSASIGSNSGVSAMFDLRINCFSRDGSGNAVPILPQITVASFTGSSIQKLSGIVLLPANASWVEIVALKNSSAVASSLELNEPVFRRTIDSDLLGPEAVTDASTIQAPSIATPGAGSLTVAQAPRTIDAGDGRVDIQVTMAAAAVPAGATNVEFIVDFNAGGTPDLRYFPAIGLKGSFVAAVGKLYSVVHRGVSFNNRAGSPLATPVTITPVKNAGGATDPSGVSIVYFWGTGFGIRYDAITDPDYLITDIAYNGSGTTPPVDDSTIIQSLPSRGGSSTTLSVFRPFLTGLTTYIWIRHVNKSGGRSNWIVAGLYTSPGILAQYLASDAFNDGISAMGVGDIGTTAFLKKTSTGTASPGTIINGVDLVYSDTSLSTGANPPGSWECMGRCPSGQATHWLRKT